MNKLEQLLGLVNHISETVDPMPKLTPELDARGLAFEKAVKAFVKKDGSGNTHPSGDSDKTAFSWAKAKKAVEKRDEHALDAIVNMTLHTEIPADWMDKDWKDICDFLTDGFEHAMQYNAENGNDDDEACMEDDEAYDNAEMDDALLLEPVGVINGEFKVKINGGEYGYKPGPNYSGDIAALEKEFLYKMAYPGKALAWLKANTTLSSRPGGGKVASAPSTKSKEVSSDKVTSSSGTGEYTVKNYDDGAWTCTCPHHMHRGVECKHIQAVQAQKANPSKIAASATGK